jgi:hypothetical protein
MSRPLGRPKVGPHLSISLTEAQWSWLAARRRGGQSLAGVLRDVIADAMDIALVAPDRRRVLIEALVDAQDLRKYQAEHGTSICGGEADPAFELGARDVYHDLEMELRKAKE